MQGTCLVRHVVGTEATKERRSDRVPMVRDAWLVMNDAYSGALATEMQKVKFARHVVGTGTPNEWRSDRVPKFNDYGFFWG